MSATNPKATAEVNPEEHTYNVKQLPVFSPYKVIGIDTVTKPVSGTRKDTGATYSFDSKNHILSIQPVKNDKLIIKVNMFDQEYQTLRAIADLYNGFDKCLITTSIDPSSTSRNVKLIHSAQKIA